MKTHLAALCTGCFFMFVFAMGCPSPTAPCENADDCTNNQICQTGTCVDSTGKDGGGTVDSDTKDTSPKDTGVNKDTKTKEASPKEASVDKKPAKPKFTFPGEAVSCKVNQSFEKLKSILAGGKNNPTGRGEQSGVYDPCNERIVLFGGNDFQPQQCADFGPKRFKGDTWIYVLKYKNWVKIKTKVSPHARGRHAYAFDLSRKLIYIHGGRHRPEGQSGSYTLFSDMWSFDVNTDTWARFDVKGDVPSARTNHAMVYDDINDQLIMFGGNSSTSGLSFNALNDTYILNLKTKTWKRIQTAKTPIPRLFHAMAFDGTSKQAIIFGGGGNGAFQGPFYRDVWGFDVEKKTWTNLWAKNIINTGPAARINTVMLEDRKNKQIVVFGGHDDTAIGHRNDIWVFKIKTKKWELKKAGDSGTGSGCKSFCRCSPDFVTVTPNTPERREYHTFSQQVGSQNVILFGGKTDCGYIDDTWYLNLDTFTWTKIHDASQGEACKRTGRANCKELCY